MRYEQPTLESLSQDVSELKAIIVSAVSPRQSIPNSKDKFLTVDEISERLQLDVQSVRNLIKSRQLKGYKFGKLFRVKSSDFETFLQISLVR